MPLHSDHPWPGKIFYSFDHSVFGRASHNRQALAWHANRLMMTGVDQDVKTIALPGIRALFLQQPAKARRRQKLRAMSSLHGAARTMVHRHRLQMLHQGSAAIHVPRLQAKAYRQERFTIFFQLFQQDQVGLLTV